jgi:polygalacturonase
MKCHSLPILPFVFSLMLTLSALADSETGNTFNVKTFGATGDGTTLDSPSINKAIDACAQAGGGTVYFPAGTY